MTLTHSTSVFFLLKNERARPRLLCQVIMMQSPGSKPVKSASILFILLSLILLFQSPIPRRFATSSLHMSSVNDAAQDIPPIANIVISFNLFDLIISAVQQGSSSSSGNLLLSIPHGTT